LTFTGSANVKLNPGLYYIDGVSCGGGKKGSCSGGNLTITGLISGASITGTGVTIVLTNVNGSYSGGIDIDPGTTCNATSAVVSLTAPGPGAGLLLPSARGSQGLLIFQDPTAVTGSTPSTTITTGKTSTGCSSATVTLSGAIVTPASDITLQGNPSRVCKAVLNSSPNPFSSVARRSLMTWDAMRLVVRGAARQAGVVLRVSRSIKRSSSKFF
jgi:hypothetical protein